MAACHRIIRQYLAQSPCIIFITDATTINFNEQQVSCKMNKAKHHELPLPPLAVNSDDFEYTKLLRSTSFSLKPMNFCILPMACNWLLALLQRVKDSLLSGSMQSSFRLFSELIVRSLIFNG